MSSNSSAAQRFLCKRRSVLAATCKLRLCVVLIVRFSVSTCYFPLVVGSSDTGSVEVDPSLATTLAIQPKDGGNQRCWFGKFTYEFCCTALPEGNSDCWDKVRYTYKRCCLATDEELPSNHPPVNPEASKKWRVACDRSDVGGWMVHELKFYEDAECETKHVQRYARLLDSGHRKSFNPGHAFDQWVSGTDEYFWYSLPAAETTGGAWLGMEFVRPMVIRCVRLWHNNIPAVPVLLQRWNESLSSWTEVHRWRAARGGDWATLSRGVNSSSSNTSALGAVVEVDTGDPRVAEL